MCASTTPRRSGTPAPSPGRRPGVAQPSAARVSGPGASCSKRERASGTAGSLGCRRVRAPRGSVWVDDRVAPVVERDPLREELGAEAVPVAGDRVDAERALIAHAHCTGRAATRVSAHAAASAPRVTCELVARRRRAQLSTKRAAPSGCRHAPRPRTCAVQRSSRARPTRAPVRELARAPSAIARGRERTGRTGRRSRREVASDARASRDAACRAPGARRSRLRRGAPCVKRSPAASAAATQRAEVAADEDCGNGSDRAAACGRAGRRASSRARSRRRRGRATAPESVTSAVPGASALPSRAEPGGAEPRDQRDVRERLDVLDERRRAARHRARTGTAA